MPSTKAPIQAALSAVANCFDIFFFIVLILS